MLEGESVSENGFAFRPHRPGRGVFLNLPHAFLRERDALFNLFRLKGGSLRASIRTDIRA
jgi:hypothetical protein